MDEFRALVEQTSFDSAALGGSSAVVHQFAQEGPCQATIFRHDVSIGTIDLNFGVPPAGPAEPREAPHLNLPLLARAAAPVPIEVAQGYALFHAPAGETGYAVTVQMTGGAETFDSRELGPGDVFSTLVLRPGTYALKNTVNSTEGTVTVDYPVVGSTPYQPPEALSVDAGDAGFTPAAIALRPAQGLVIHVKTRARITIDLTTPDDGPHTSDR